DLGVAPADVLVRLRGVVGLEAQVLAHPPDRVAIDDAGVAISATHGEARRNLPAGHLRSRNVGRSRGIAAVEQYPTQSTHRRQSDDGDNRRDRVSTGRHRLPTLSWMEANDVHALIRFKVGAII